MNWKRKKRSDSGLEKKPEIRIKFSISVKSDCVWVINEIPLRFFRLIELVFWAVFLLLLLAFLGWTSASGSVVNKLIRMRLTMYFVWLWINDDFPIESMAWISWYWMEKCKVIQCGGGGRLIDATGPLSAKSIKLLFFFLVCAKSSQLKYRPEIIKWMWQTKTDDYNTLFVTICKQDSKSLFCVQFCSCLYFFFSSDCVSFVNFFLAFIE